MPHTTEETTSPATADAGMRTFEIRGAFHTLQLSVLHLEDRAPSDEPVGLQMTGNVVENRTLAVGLIALANRLLNTPGQSLPTP